MPLKKGPRQQLKLADIGCGTGAATLARAQDFAPDSPDAMVGRLP